jgi:chemotaxis protein MotB
MTPHQHAPQDEQGYLASVSDVMAGLLFIFIITVVVFAIALLQQRDAHGEAVDRLTGIRDEQRELLLEIERLLRERGVVVRVDADQGVLRLGEQLLFDSGSALLDDTGLSTVRELSQVLADVLPCYTKVDGLPVDREGCGRRGSRGRVDALFVEGHTDNQPVRLPRPGLQDNWDLSAARAKAIYERLRGEAPLLDVLQNEDAQPILGLSGYAHLRPIASNDLEPERAQNRRIDLRFIMSQPRDALPAAALETQERMRVTP